MRRKKGMELSMNTIIVAVIALIVLVVVVLIFTGRFGIFTRGLNDCAQRGGVDSTHCTKTAAECVNKGGMPSGDCIFYDKDGKPTNTNKDDVCCVIKK